MIRRVHHLHDDRLLDCYLAERAGEATDPPVVEHLSDCAECGARYRELSRFMDDLRSDAESETDEIFTLERLHIQQQQIARRLEHVGHAARVISFPARLVRRHITATGRVAPRWAAVAAAAGLFVGVALGMFYDSAPRPRPAAVPAVRVTPPVVAATVPSPTLDTDVFLSELDTALGGPRTPELMPFDALTPHIQEISTQLR